MGYKCRSDVKVTIVNKVDQSDADSPGMRAMKHVLHMTHVSPAMLAIDSPEPDAPAMHVRQHGVEKGYITLSGDTWDIVAKRVIRHLQIPMKKGLGNRLQRRAAAARARGRVRSPSGIQAGNPTGGTEKI